MNLVRIQERVEILTRTRAHFPALESQEAWRDTHTNSFGGNTDTEANSYARHSDKEIEANRINEWLMLTPIDGKGHIT